MDLHVPAQRNEIGWPVLAAIAVGGALGSLARYGLAQLLPAEPGRVPWATFTVNVVGCALIGVLMVVITEVLTPHRLLRPLLGVGVLGGLTTFSTFAVEVHGLLRPGTVLVGVAYLFGSLLCGFAATAFSMAVTRLVCARRSS
ncbi:fluoride efflux transporter CrcB [Kutzneria viridogrisea]|uniref:Fluoride-specific ion channel FluC n=1 Tax=Kutzneria albida DSM 43870 TaxID=1449976 RepID=W5W322_9PSEU|nr:putative membrane protein [Kutzneria albida DSM 43870]